MDIRGGLLLGCERLSKPHLFFPIIDNGGGLSRTSWALSLAIACKTVLSDCKVTFQAISYPYPDGAMLIASHDFMESGADAMVNIDTDIVFTRDNLTKLLSHDVPLVFGLYPKKQLGLTFPVQGLEGGRNPLENDGTPTLREVARCARGFMKVKREVFDAMQPHVEKYEDPQTGRDQFLYWKTLAGGHSEDFAFCDLWRSLGGKVYCDIAITCEHEGSAVYPIKGTY